MSKPPENSLINLPTSLNAVQSKFAHSMASRSYYNELNIQHGLKNRRFSPFNTLVTHWLLEEPTRLYEIITGREAITGRYIDPQQRKIMASTVAAEILIVAGSFLFPAFVLPILGLLEVGPVIGLVNFAVEKAREEVEEFVVPPHVKTQIHDHVRQIFAPYERNRQRASSHRMAEAARGESSIKRVEGFLNHMTAIQELERFPANSLSVRLKKWGHQLSMKAEQHPHTNQTQLNGLHQMRQQTMKLGLATGILAGISMVHGISNRNPGEAMTGLALADAAFATSAFAWNMGAPETSVKRQSSVIYPLVGKAARMVSAPLGFLKL